MASTRRFALASLSCLPLAALVACGDPPVVPEEPLARIDLRAALGQADVQPVGVTVDASGARVVLDEQAGLYRVDGDGTATVVLAMADLPDPGLEVEIRRPFTDLVALAPGQFALTAIGDGFLLDVGARTLARHFCYEPGGFPTDQEQRTNGLAYDPAVDRLYAQPRTFEDGEVVRSEVAVFSRPDGDDLAWLDVPDDLDGGGLAVAPGGGALWVGTGARLLRFDLTTARLSTADDLRRFGVGRIDGLTVDTVAQTLLVVDGDDDELIELDLAQLDR